MPPTIARTISARRRRKVRERRGTGVGGWRVGEVDLSNISSDADHPEGVAERSWQDAVPHMGLRIAWPTRLPCSDPLCSPH